MIKYWPNQQGIELNKEVAYLFFRIRQKFAYNLLNRTHDSLYIDLLDNSARSKLFSLVLIELEILVLDIVELDLSLANIRILNYKILYDLVNKSLYHFLSLLELNEIGSIFLNKKRCNYLQVTLSSHKLLLEYLLIYLIFGSSCIKDKIFAFSNIYTPKEHVSILIENLVIQISNIIIFTIIESIQSLSIVTSFINNNQLCNSSYISIRSIAFFRNNLLMQNFINLYLGQPKEIYSSRYKVWLISSNGIISKYIYISRLDDFAKLSGVQLMVLFFMEIQDLIIPQLEKMILILSRIIFYILINCLGNSAIFCIRAILTGINNMHK